MVIKVHQGESWLTLSERGCEAKFPEHENSESKGWLGRGGEKLMDNLKTVLSLPDRMIFSYKSMLQ